MLPGRPDRTTQEEWRRRNLSGAPGVLTVLLSGRVLPLNNCRRNTRKALLASKILPGSESMRFEHRQELFNRDAFIC